MGYQIISIAPSVRHKSSLIALVADFFIDVYFLHGLSTDTLIDVQYIHFESGALIAMVFFEDRTIQKIKRNVITDLSSPMRCQQLDYTVQLISNVVH